MNVNRSGKALRGRNRLIAQTTFFTLSLIILFIIPGASVPPAFSAMPVNPTFQLDAGVYGTNPAVAYSSLQDSHLAVSCDDSNPSHIYATLITSRGEQSKGLQINGFGNQDQTPKIAYDSVYDRFLAIWLRKSAGSTGSIIGRFLSWNGEPITQEFVIEDLTNNSENHKSQLNISNGGGGYLIVWDEEVGSKKLGSGVFVPGTLIIRGRGISNSGFSDHSFTIATAYPEDRSRPSVAFNAKTNTHMVAYDRVLYDGSNTDVYFRHVRYDGSNLQNEQKLVAWPARETNLSVAWCSDWGQYGQYLLLWSSYEPSINITRLYGWQLAGDGTPQYGPFIISETPLSTYYSATVSARYGVQYLVVYHSQVGGAVEGRLIYADGTMDAPFQISNKGFSPVVATADYNFVVLYNLYTGGAMKTFGSIVGDLPPSPPSVMSNSATDMTKNSFTANWGASAGAFGYRLDVATTATFDNSYLPGYMNLDVGNVTSKQVTGLNNNTTYYYRVRAYNAWGVSRDCCVGVVMTALNTVAIKIEHDAMGYVPSVVPWTLTGPNSFNQSGIGNQNLTNLAPGSYTLTWGAVKDWSRPSPAFSTQILPAEGTITFAGTYTQNSYSRLYFPHIATSIPWQTEIAIINTGDEAFHDHLGAYSDTGEHLDDRLIDLPINGRRQINIADEFADHTKIAYLALSSVSPVLGYTKFSREGYYRAAIPAVRKVNTQVIHIPHIASNADWWTGVSLLNTNYGPPKTVTITFNNGQSVPFTLNHFEHKAFNIASLFNNQPPPDIQSAFITNADGVIGLELFGSLGWGTQLDGILLTDKTFSTIYYPHVPGDGWWTGIVAYNPSVAACSITITPYSAQGTPLPTSTLSIPGLGKYIGTVAELGLPAQTAWFKIDSTSPISGFELFGTVDGNHLAAYAGGEGTGAYEGIFPKIEKNGGWTGIAFVNTEATAASVTLTAYNDQGTAVATQVLPVGGHAKVVNNPEAIFSQDISGATYVSYTSDKKMVGFQLNGTPGGMMLDGLPALGRTN